MGEAMHVWSQRVYRKSLYLLKFAHEPKIALKIVLQK